MNFFRFVLAYQLPQFYKLIYSSHHAESDLSFANQAAMYGHTVTTQ